ncbi:putative DNA binding domain-containing protein [Myxococcota bacterium]|nr:putative DNA binding domain-containing protein [Myxococcota bacterium]
MKRLTDQELLDLLDDTESDRAERKQSFKGDTPSKSRQAVCAFANDLPNHNEPGILFVGVRDDGTPSHEPITDRLLQSLADMKTDGNILPMPVISVEKRLLKGAEMAVVVVMPSDMPPVKFEGRIWIRTGPRRAIANEQEERILIEKRRYKNLPFDLYPIPTAHITDLSRVIFEAEFLPAAFASDVLEENGRSYEERLASCKMIVSPTDTTPTVLGLLALGKSPQDFLRGASIQFLRIDGIHLEDPVVDEEEMGGAVVEMLRRVEEKLRAHNRSAVDVTSNATHEIEHPYPMAALLQIVYNAVFHRTYERTNAPIRVYWFNDRIEVNSPGGPYGNVTPENFGQPGVTDYRNPNIGDILKTFGFIQGFGRGIAIARKEMQKNGNPPIEFQTNQSLVLCTLRKKP